MHQQAGGGNLVDVFTLDFEVVDGFGAGAGEEGGDLEVLAGVRAEAAWVGDGSRPIRGLSAALRIAYSRTFVGHSLVR